MNAVATRDVPESVTEAMNRALDEAEKIGLTPVRYYLGPAKWNAFRALVEQHATFTAASEPPIPPASFWYNGLPVERGAFHGILLHCND